ncbi:secreted repeat protein with Y-X4-D motif [Streptomyces sp. Amel2xB2]|uniref:SCO0930 family lipoprotein n=1 Tax=Streptomyces sp. Amel2xB2 TaxID=1305829 RepID=UPI000DB988A3|nr:SCO0930 family lipoprotein [Streptomyces sp. Amel2xB2]RAJ60547.1 secreted repeat protein with Y-X4-D motif [Streptomyces sp. Amel2xB2]
MRMQRHVALIGTALAVALFATGCGSDGNDYSGQKLKPAGQAADDGSGGDSSGTSRKEEPAKALQVKRTAKLGDVVTDSKGWTLYRFDEDTAAPSQSNCNGDCEKMWPPVPAKDAEATAGIAEKDLGKVKRADGSYQLTVGGWPAYRFAKDAKPGDLEGHGAKGMWNALAPNGGKASARNVKQLTAVENKELGKILTDAKGHTLYRFDKDSAWPMKSNCNGDCLKSWVPAKAVEKDKVEGVDPKLLSTYERADGTKQLSVDCWPLYWFKGDKKAGDINGQGKMGLWHAATDKGKKAGVTP